MINGLDLLNGLDLFSGIGGISYALRHWMRPIAYCEIDSYCQAVLLSRMVTNDLYMAPVWDDVSTLEGQQFRGIVDIIYGGFPCQDISVAGTGKGLAGERSGLFYQIVRLAKEIKPKFIFLENVPAITCRGGIEVVNQITSLGYDCRWCIISAASLGAPHKRDRWFLLANSKSDRMQESRAKERIETRQPKPMVSGIRSYWEENQCPLCGVDDGISYRMDRIKGLGNSVVPQQAKEAFKRLMGL